MMKEKGYSIEKPYIFGLNKKFCKSKHVSVMSMLFFINKIFLFRGKKVMIDRDLAELYGVETRILNRAVRRNIDRFPADFMFQLNKQEINNWKSQIGISNRERMGLRKNPLVFTEQGVTITRE